MYRSLFHQFGVTGLAIASDIGILMHTVVLAWLLHRTKDGAAGRAAVGELTKALVTRSSPGSPLMAAGRMIAVRGSLKADLISLA